MAKRAEASRSWPDDAVFTVGHSTLPAERFVAVLRAYGIERIADVRTVPRSRHNPQFGEAALAETLRAAGIAYVRLPALGGLRRARRDSANTGWRNAGFRGYADYMQTSDFACGLEALIDAAAQEPIALMCAEAVPWRCHRSLIADSLTARGYPVEHIMTATKSNRHSMTSFARVEGTSITYPADVNVSSERHSRSAVPC